jgi:predicted ATPase
MMSNLRIEEIAFVEAKTTIDQSLQQRGGSKEALTRGPEMSLRTKGSERPTPKEGMFRRAGIDLRLRTIPRRIRI